MKTKVDRPVTLRQLLRLEELAGHELPTEPTELDHKVRDVVVVTRLGTDTGIPSHALVVTEHRRSAGYQTELLLRRAATSGAVGVLLTDADRLMLSTRRLADRLRIPLVALPACDPVNLAWRLSRHVHDPRFVRGDDAGAAAPPLGGTHRPARAVHHRTRGEGQDMNPELDLSIERVIRAPRKVVWDAWTDPANLAQWWLPAPTLCRVDRLEVRAGGAFVTRMSDDDATFVPHLDACFLRVDELERIVFTNAVDGGWRPANPGPVTMTAEITMHDHADGTDYRIVVRHGDPAARDRHTELGFADGWGNRRRPARPLRGERPMKIAVTQFVTLDGVSQGPGSPTEDTSDGFTSGGWLVPYLDEAFVKCTSERLDLADGLLLGRRTYEAFARDWPQITDPDDPFTERMNSLPKYVGSSTLARGTWRPTTVLRGDAAQAVRELSESPGRKLQVHGSARLGNALLAAGLVDTLRLAVAPVVLGTGRRLLTHPGSATGLRLVRHEATTQGLLLLEYETAGAAPVGEHRGVTDLP